MRLQESWASTYNQKRVDLANRRAFDGAWMPNNAMTWLTHGCIARPPKLRLSKRGTRLHIAADLGLFASSIFGTHMERVFRIETDPAVRICGPRSAQHGRAPRIIDLDLCLAQLKQ